MITLPQLMLVAELPWNTQEEVLEQLETLSEGQVVQIMDTCWQLIFQKFDNNLQYELQKAAFEAAQGQRTLTKDDINKIQDDLFQQLIEKFDIAGDAEKIEEVREKLQQTKNPEKTVN